MKREVLWTVEAPNYPSADAQRVLDLIPDEWHAVIARPVLLHPEHPCGPGCAGEACETGVYGPGQDGWGFYEGDAIGARYVLMVVAVQDMLDGAIREKSLEKVRHTLGR